jgi:hypothetical protein
MRVCGLALVLGGCGFAVAPGGGGGGGAPDASSVDTLPDAAVDAAIDAFVEPVCLGTFIRVCVSPPAAVRTFAAEKIDTSTSQDCVPYTSTPMVSACVITGTSITIPATLTVTGGRPLILLATDEITVSGTLDGSSRDSATGPAADTGPCQANFTNPTTGAQGGGGWGGSFGGNGNNGGNSAGGGIGGIAATQGNVSTLTGGCAGSNGADNGIGSGAGARGHSGGALLLIAKEGITITGTINASGGGGEGASGGGGGGGGGSGGMIVLDARTVSTTGRCFANGGGGGEGASLVNGRDGNESTSPATPGTGGSGQALGGGNGGNGAFGLTGSQPGTPGSNANPLQGGSGGGGGGGGSVGVIKVFADDQEGTRDLNRVSPPPT